MVKSKKKFFPFVLDHATHSAVEGQAELYEKYPRIHLERVTPVMALDCEMVRANRNDGSLNKKGNPACFTVLGRLSLVNDRQETVLDVFVANDDCVSITNTNLRFSGIRWKNLDPKNGAMPFHKVLDLLYEILEGKTLVGHAIENDLKVLKLIEVHAKSQCQYRSAGDLGVTLCDTQRLFQGAWPSPDATK